MIQKKLIHLAVISLIVFTGFAVEAQQRLKPFKVGVLTPGERQWEGAAFRSSLCSLGYMENKNVSFEYRFADGKTATKI